MHCRLQRLAALAMLLMLVSVSELTAAAPARFEDAVQPFLQKYCLRCHNDRKQEGEFRLDTLSRDFTQLAPAQQWEEVIFRLNASEMPPADEPQPAAEELGKVVDWLAARSREGAAARMARRGPVTHFRLSRTEYQYTIYDLLGVYYDVQRPGVFNPDPLWHGFDRIGSMLTLSPSHVEHYLDAADEIVASANLNRPIKYKKNRKVVTDFRRFEDGELEAMQAQLKALGRQEPMRYLIWPGGRMPGLSANWLGAREGSGLFRAKIQVSGLAGLNGDVPHLTVRGGPKGATRTFFDADVLTPEDQPVILEFEAYLALPAALTIFNESPGEFTAKQGGASALGSAVVLGAYKEASLLSPTAFKLFTEEGRSIYPLLLVDWIEWEGPILPEAIEARRRQYHPQPSGDLNAARLSLKTLAQHAWRRPVTDAEIEPYIDLVANELQAGEKFEAAYHAALVSILASSNFYYLQEGSPLEQRPTVNDWELAARLSYFLFSSLPDEPLFAAAEAGTLHEPAELRRQLARMFEDPKFARFLEAFPYQWLQLHRVGMFPPNENLYPEYGPWLERSMIAETRLYFRTMFVENRPLREFLDSDWAILNPRLRQHYGLPAASATGFQRVRLKPEDHRGGILSQASALMLTSDGQRHRPVHRGVWLSEAIFNYTPPAPPPNVEPLEPTPDDAPKATIRQQLEAHATQSTCASCHRKIDPLGFAFENYDAIGRWRTEETASGQGKNPPVDASGTLPDGRSFRGPAEFKALLVQDQPRFARAFVEQLATYALRRVPTSDDAAAIEAIVTASQADDYRLRTVIENFVLSELFRKR